ncbi:MAG: hypothetical protein ACWA5K_04450, partial [bacterium]
QRLQICVRDLDLGVDQSRANSINIIVAHKIVSAISRQDCYYPLSPARCKIAVRRRTGKRHCVAYYTEFTVTRIKVIPIGKV